MLASCQPFLSTNSKRALTMGKKSSEADANLSVRIISVPKFSVVGFKKWAQNLIRKFPNVLRSVWDLWNFSCGLVSGQRSASLPAAHAPRQHPRHAAVAPRTAAAVVPTVAALGSLWALGQN